MTTTVNPQRPTDTGKLVLFGIVGGVIVAIVVFVSASSGPEGFEWGRRIGVWSVRLLLVTVILAGGWQRLRRRR